jgi:hypothetical protein
MKRAARSRGQTGVALRRVLAASRASSPLASLFQT